MAETTAVAEKKEETAVQHINKVTDFSLGIFGTSDNFTMAYQMAKALSQSTLVPREYQKSEANCMIAIDLAIRMKTSPFLVMQNDDKPKEKCEIYSVRPRICREFICCPSKRPSINDLSYKLKCRVVDVRKEFYENN